MPSNPTGSRSKKRHYCSFCTKDYSTNSHLRRHEQTHTRAVTLPCPACKRHFTRPDVARRHAQKCVSHGQITFKFPEMRRGQRPRSCDRCSTRKVSCDALVPCGRCSSAQLQCTYRRIFATAATDALGTPSISSAPRTSTYFVPVDGNVNDHGLRRTGESQPPRIRLDFLLKFTHPSPYGTAAAVVIDSADEFDLRYETETVDLLPFLASGPFELGEEDGFPSLFEAPSHISEMEQEQAEMPLSPPSNDEFARRAQEIITQLSATYDLLKGDPDVATDLSFNPKVAEGLFTQVNLCQFVRAYFGRFHRYNPIIHRATFDMVAAPLPLLLAIFLFGSLCSASHDDALSAREFFGVAEEYIFRHPVMVRLLRGYCSGDNSIEEIQHLQAAYTMVIVQNGSGNAKTTKRLRQVRYPSLVAAMRILALFGAKRRFLLHELPSVAWEDFVVDETRIRLATWVFMTDSLFATFYNKPPDITLCEMTGDLPCEEELFEAQSGSEYTALACQTARTAAQSSSLFEIATSFLEKPRKNSREQPDLHYTPSQLLFCIGALQSVALIAASSSLTQGTSDIILEATKRWKAHWDDMATRMAPKPSRLTGFAAHALELWWLANTMAKARGSPESHSRYKPLVPTDSLQHLHDFIQMYKEE